MREEVRADGAPPRPRPSRGPSRSTCGSHRNRGPPPKRSAASWAPSSPSSRKTSGFAGPGVPTRHRSGRNSPKGLFRLKLACAELAGIGPTRCIGSDDLGVHWKRGERSSGIPPRRRQYRGEAWPMSFWLAPAHASEPRRWYAGTSHPASSSPTMPAPPGRRWTRIGRSVPKEIGDIGFPHRAASARVEATAWGFPVEGGTGVAAHADRRQARGLRDARPRARVVATPSTARLPAGARQVHREAPGHERRDTLGPVGLYFGTTSGEVAEQASQRRHRVA